MSELTAGRRPPPTVELFRNRAEILSIAVSDTSGADLQEARSVMVTPDMEIYEVSWKKGAREAPSRDSENSTIACLLSGRLRLTIGDETFVAEPGDSWMYPQGVMHHGEAIEDSAFVKVVSLSADG